MADHTYKASSSNSFSEPSFSASHSFSAPPSSLFIDDASLPVNYEDQHNPSAPLDEPSPLEVETLRKAKDEEIAYLRGLLANRDSRIAQLTQLQRDETTQKQKNERNVHELAKIGLTLEKLVPNENKKNLTATLDDFEFNGFDVILKMCLM
jgi:hypothetical protein